MCLCMAEAQREEADDKPLDEADKMLPQEDTMPLKKPLFMEPVMLLLPMRLLVMTHFLLSVTVFLESLAKTIPSILKFLSLVSLVMDKLMEVTMLTLRLNVKHSTFAQLMELEVWPSTASSVLMVHSSTRTTSSVTGGSTLT